MDKKKSNTTTKKDDSIHKKQGIGVITKSNTMKEEAHEK